MQDELNPYPGNLKHHKVEKNNHYDKELIEKILREIKETVQSRLDENPNAPGSAIHARIQDLQHINTIAKKYNLNIK